MRIEVQSGGDRSTLDVEVDEHGLRVTRDGGPARRVVVLHHDDTTLSLEIDGRRHRVRWARRGSDLHLSLCGHAVRMHRVEEEEQDDLDLSLGSPVVRAPMPGRVLEVLVRVGDRVQAGQTVARVEAMKMEVSLVAAVDGAVTQVHAQAEQLVQPDEAIVTITPDADPA